MTDVALTLAGAALALLGLLHLWRRRRPLAAVDAIRLVSSRHLGGKRYLTIVEVEGERLLLGVSDEQVSLVTRLGAACPATGTEAGPAAP